MDTFYEIPKEIIKDLFYEAKDKSFQCWCDEKHHLDWKRIKSLKTFDEVFKLLEDSKESRYVFINRENMWGDATVPDKVLSNRIDIGGEITADGIDYFIFIFLEIKHLQYFIDKYNLKQAVYHE